MKARVFVTLKNGVLDPQGKAIGHALNGLGFGSVGEVRQGKVIDLEIAETDQTKAKASLKDMCEKLLANTVIEKYEIELKHDITPHLSWPATGGHPGGRKAPAPVS
jgi:phosphoribosylformylglycinamidine synthase PurS subunit